MEHNISLESDLGSFLTFLRGECQNPGLAGSKYKRFLHEWPEEQSNFLIKICRSPERRHQFERKCEISIWGGDCKKEKKVIIVRGASTVSDDLGEYLFRKMRKKPQQIEFDDTRFLNIPPVIIDDNQPIIIIDNQPLIINNYLPHVYCYIQLKYYIET